MTTETIHELVFLDHANDRMEQRGISASEVEEALSNGEPSDVPVELQGMIRIVGTTSSNRRLSVTRLEHFPVVVSVVEVQSSK